MTGRRIALRLLAATVLAIAGVMPAVAQDEPRVSISTSVNYFVGDYGTGKDTTFVYVPVTLGVRPLDRLWLSVTVPYLYQSNQNVVLTGGGAAARKSGKGKFGRPGDDTTEQGIGDVLGKVSYVLVEEKELVPEVTPYVKIKFPTADSDRGLGTGEFDETLGVELSKRLTNQLTAFLSFSYTFIGSPAGEDLRDSFGWSLGADYAVTPPLSLFAFLEFSTAIDQSQPDLELRVGAEYRVTKALSLIGAVSRGFTEGSLDWGVSASVGVRF